MPTDKDTPKEGCVLSLVDRLGGGDEDGAARKAFEHAAGQCLTRKDIRGYAMVVVYEDGIAVAYTHGGGADLAVLGALDVAKTHILGGVTVKPLKGTD